MSRGVRTTTGTPITARFPGQWFQSESGLHQNWMRDYDPTTGRYLQADPLGLVDGASVYGYALQNPGRWTDPRGENVGTVVGGVIGGAIDWGTGVLVGGIGIVVGVIVYPSTPGDGTLPPSLIPREAAQCMAEDGDRCEIVREVCHSYCVNYFVEGPFPGRDQLAGYRKCMRTCMKARDCKF